MRNSSALKTTDKNNMLFMAHSSSDVKTTNIGEGTTIWQFCVVFKNAVIGANCNINAHVLIENDVIIGNNVTVKSGVQIWDGLRIEDNVFIGPNVTFTNDLRPRSKQYPIEFPKTVIKKNATIGANATILPGIIIGENSMVGAAALVTKSVPARALVTGNPARIKAWLNEDGTKMEPITSSSGSWKDNKGQIWQEINNILTKYE